MCVCVCARARVCVYGYEYVCTVACVRACQFDTVSWQMVNILSDIRPALAPFPQQQQMLKTGAADYLFTKVGTT